MKKNNDWKDRLNVVYSTNPDFKFDNGEEDEPETLEPGKQQLRISLDKRNRNGKSVTLDILIQGDFRQKVLEILLSEGYRARII